MATVEPGPLKIRCQTSDRPRISVDFYPPGPAAPSGYISIKVRSGAALLGETVVYGDATILEPAFAEIERHEHLGYAGVHSHIQQSEVRASVSVGAAAEPSYNEFD